jgi:PKD repeat protein
VFVRSNESKTLVARFTASAISGPAPLTVDFTDSSLGEPKRLEWDFDNDRTVDSSAKSQKWTYAHAGVYSVRLRVIRAGVSDLLVREGIITVYEPKP